MPRVRGFQILAMATIFALMVSSRSVQGADQTEDGEGPVDWPALISRLQQRVYDHPGLAQARHQLATAYNNYGVQLGQEGQWNLAVRQFQEAIRLADDDQQFKRNLANVRMNQAYDAYQRHQIPEALQALDQTVTLDPELVQAYVLRGQIEYDRQQLKEAKAAWERAVALDPSQTELAQRLKQVTQELPVESKFERLSQSYFDLRYEEQVERPVGFDIRDALYEARRTVGSDFAYWPDRKFVVLIYSAESFRALRQEVPDWVGGQFDGKIRVPLPSAQLDQAIVRQVLFHEYTHALVHDLAKDACPTWLNEGLAEYEGRTQAPGDLTLLAGARDAGQLIPWLQLSEHITGGESAQAVGLAYEQSYSIIAYLAAQHGFWRFRRLLKTIGEGTPWLAAMEQEYHLKLTRLEGRWQAWLPEWLKSR